MLPFANHFIVTFRRSFASFACLVALACLLGVWPTQRARALDSACPRPESPRYCEQRERKLELRRVQAEQAAALAAYRRTHPWTLRIDFVPSLAMFGLKATHYHGDYTVGMWGGGLGLSVLRDFRYVALMMEGLARAGAGGIHAWSAHGGNPSRSSGLIVGGELHAELRLQHRGFFVGPGASVGVLHFTDPTNLGSHGKAGGDISANTVIYVPKNASFAGAGLSLGRGFGETANIEVGGRFMVGAWDQFERAYVQAGIVIAGRVWD